MDQNGGGGNMSTGSLRTKISLKGGYSQLSLVPPFYGMKSELPPQSPLLGSDDLIDYLGLSSSYGRYCGPKKLRDDLPSFLPQLCGTSKLNEQVDPAWKLQKLVEKPPIQKEIQPLSTSQMIGFKLAPGPVPPEYRLFDSTPADSSLFSMVEASGQQEGAGGSEYHEFGKNFHDPEEEKAKHRKRMKWSLDDMDDSDKRAKKKGGGEGGEKEKKQKKKKKEKKKKKDRDDEERRKERPEPPSVPFY